MATITGVWKFLRAIFQRPSPIETDDEVEWAINEILKGTDPRLRLIHGHRRELRPPVIHALGYIDDLMAQLPSAIELSTKAYSTDPRLGSFFASRDELQDHLRESDELRDFFSYSLNSGQHECFAALRMIRDEKPVLGMCLNGELLTRDIAQLSVNFRNQRVVAPARTEAEVRGLLKRKGFRYLVQCAHAQLLEIQVQAATLKSERARLRSILKNKTYTERDNEPGVSRKLEQVERASQVLRSQTVNDHLEKVLTVFTNPEPFLRLHKVELVLSTMNIKLDRKAGVEGIHHTLYEAEGKPSLPRIAVLLVKCRREDLTIQQPL